MLPFICFLIANNFDQVFIAQFLNFHIFIVALPSFFFHATHPSISKSYWFYLQTIPKSNHFHLPGITAAASFFLLTTLLPQCYPVPLYSNPLVTPKLFRGMSKFLTMVYKAPHNCPFCPSSFVSYYPYSRASLVAQW